jgi:hypothetical protein
MDGRGQERLVSERRYGAGREGGRERKRELQTQRREREREREKMKERERGEEREREIVVHPRSRAKERERERERERESGGRIHAQNCGEKGAKKRGWAREQDPWKGREKTNLHGRKISALSNVYSRAK